jgi:hypothetical protein
LFSVVVGDGNVQVQIGCVWSERKFNLSCFSCQQALHLHRLAPHHFTILVIQKRERNRICRAMASVADFQPDAYLFFVAHTFRLQLNAKACTATQLIPLRIDQRFPLLEEQFK